MITFAIYDITTGEILRFVSSPCDHVEQQLQEGEEFFLNCDKEATHIIDGAPTKE